MPPRLAGRRQPPCLGHHPMPLSLRRASEPAGIRILPRRPPMCSVARGLLQPRHGMQFIECDVRRRCRSRAGQEGERWAGCSLASTWRPFIGARLPSRLTRPEPQLAFVSSAAAAQASAATSMASAFQSPIGAGMSLCLLGARGEARRLERAIASPGARLVDRSTRASPTLTFRLVHLESGGFRDGLLPPDTVMTQ